MATAKKPVKKPAAKRAPAKATVKTSVKRVARPAAKRTDNTHESFKLSKSQQPFFSFRVTDQTIYWSILAIVVLALGLWVISINDKVQRMYDEIDSYNQTISDTPVKAKHP